jgi:hypothetical protein
MCASIDWDDAPVIRNRSSTASRYIGDVSLPKPTKRRAREYLPHCVVQVRLTIGVTTMPEPLFTRIPHSANSIAATW